MEYPLLVRIAYGIVRDPHLAEDVAQDVLIAAQQRFPEPLGSDHAQAWVKVATTHASLNAIRGGRRRQVRQDAPRRQRRRPAPRSSPSRARKVVRYGPRSPACRDTPRRFSCFATAGSATPKSPRRWRSISDRSGRCCVGRRPDFVRRLIMRHVPDGALRRIIDEPFAVADRDARHVEGCLRCQARSQRIAEDVATAERYFDVQVLGDTDAGLARSRGSLIEPAPSRTTWHVGRVAAGDSWALRSAPAPRLPPSAS